MAERVVDKITRYAPNFKDILIRDITFAPYHMNTMFAAPNGDFCHGLLQPELMGVNRPGPKGSSTSRSRSRACIWAARAATADRASRSSPPATTPVIRCWKTPAASDFGALSAAERTKPRPNRRAVRP